MRGIVSTERFQATTSWIRGVSITIDLRRCLRCCCCRRRCSTGFAATSRLLRLGGGYWRMLLWWHHWRIDRVVDGRVLSWLVLLQLQLQLCIL